jgi:hypothetical protein
MNNELNGLRRRLDRAELSAAHVRRPGSMEHLEPWQVFLREMSPDDRDAFFDRVMNKTRHLTRKDTQ